MKIPGFVTALVTTYFSLTNEIRDWTDQSDKSLLLLHIFNAQAKFEESK